MGHKERDKVNLLALLLNFEKYWTPYVLSDGSLYDKETREEAGKMSSLFAKIYEEKCLNEKDKGKISPPNELWKLRQLMKQLAVWSQSKDKLPPHNEPFVDNHNSSKYIQQCLGDLEKKLCEELQLSITPSICLNNCQGLYLRNVLKWSAQLPDEVIDIINSQYLNSMSKSHSLVLIADIRRSQDLVTYGESPMKYREYIMKFIEKIRAILKKNCGIFDRFTGDGFIAYFSEYMCNQQGRDYYEMMLNTCREITEFSEPFFEEWTSTLRKLPNTEIGITIGVDDGVIDYQDIDNQLFAIGDACVWATRMNKAGLRGHVILNNIPYQRIKSCLNEQNCEAVNSSTKNGEQFRAYKINIKDIKYVNHQESYRHREPGEIS